MPWWSWSECGYKWKKQLVLDCSLCSDFFGPNFSYICSRFKRRDVGRELLSFGLVKFGSLISLVFWAGLCTEVPRVPVGSHASIPHLLNRFGLSWHEGSTRHTGRQSWTQGSGPKHFATSKALQMFMHLWKANNFNKPSKAAVPAQEWQCGDLGLLDLYHLQFVLCGSCGLVFAWQRPFVQQEWRMAEMKHLSAPWSSEADDALANMSMTLDLRLAFQPLRRCPGFVWVRWSYQVFSCIIPRIREGGEKGFAAGQNWLRH